MVAIGFVSHCRGTACRARTEMGFPDESGLTFGQHGKVELGSFRVIWGWESRRDASGTGNWVRFAR